jgi:hypothetical protein
VVDNGPERIPEGLDRRANGNKVELDLCRPGWQSADVLVAAFRSRFRQEFRHQHRFMPRDDANRTLPT